LNGRGYNYEGNFDFKIKGGNEIMKEYDSSVKLEFEKEM